MEAHAGHAAGADHDARVQGAELLGQVGKAAAGAAAAAATRAAESRAQVFPDCASCLQEPVHEVLWVPIGVSSRALNGHQLQSGTLRTKSLACRAARRKFTRHSQRRLAACSEICTTHPLNVAVSNEALQREVLHQAAAH